MLLRHSWPGNVRELENVIERAVVLCESGQIEPRHLPSSVVPQEDRDGLPPVPGSSIADLERYAILKTLEACAGSTSRAAIILGMSTRKIQYKLHEYGAPPPAGAPATAGAEGEAATAGSSDPSPPDDTPGPGVE